MQFNFTGIFWRPFIFLVLVEKVMLIASGDDTPAVRVNCKTPGLMLFQIYEPKVRSLLKSPNARGLLLFSEDTGTKQPIAGCLQNYTIGDTAGWSSSFSFLTYDANSSCTVKSYVIDKEDNVQQTYVADIFIKVLSADDGVGPGRRGKIRLTCTMLASQQVESRRTDLHVEVLTPTQAVGPKAPIENNEVPLDALTAQFEGSLMLRFFKLVPGSNFPVPAVSVTEGEDIYLVAALRSGGSFAVLRPVNCSIRSVVSSVQKDTTSAVREFVHSQPGSGNTHIKEFSVLDNGCQSSQHPWEMPEEAAENNIFRLYYTKFLAPMFSGSLKLSAKCSINLCTQQNSKACIEQPKSLLGSECFTMAKNVPNFQFHSETITNISELQPANIFMQMAPVSPTRRSLFNTAATSLASRIVATTRTTETKEDKGIFKRNVTANLRNFPNLTAENKSDFLNESQIFNNNEEGGGVSQSVENTIEKFPEKTQEIKYCFLQRTVTMASVSVVVVLILSIVLVSFSIMTHCRQRKRQDRRAILDDLS